ncbi:MAG TPA: IclR family transcriptional regulator [Sphaerochaetaceae bacterium]|nr:IclR family transcriptional regulator [Sphaerochaetaceae bacterium]
MFQQINERSNSETSYQIATTVVKAFHLLEFISEHQPVQPSTMCKGLGLTRANLHRLLYTLVYLGYVEKSRMGYQVSLKLFQLGSTVPIKEQLRESAKTRMYDLERIAKENIYLTVLYHDMVIAVEEVKSSHTVVLNPDVTYTYPVNTCASGKLLLSSLSEEQLDLYLDNVTFIRKTPNTCMDKDAFKKLVRESGAQGYATEVLEFGNHLNSIAAPLYNRDGEVIACIAISGPSMRLTEEKMLTFTEPLQRIAMEISETMRYNNKTPSR